MKQLVKDMPFTFLLLLICLNCLGPQKDDYSAKLDSLLQTTTPRKFNGVILITKKGFFIGVESVFPL